LSTCVLIAAADSRDVALGVKAKQPDVVAGGALGSPLGSIFTLEKLAGRNVVALLDRAEA